MENKRFIVICATVIIIVSGLIWWNLSTSITNIPPMEVSKIEIFDGNTGNAIIITDGTDIEHIIKNLNEVSIKKEKISLGHVGYSFRMTIYKTDGTVYKKAK